MCEDCNNEIWLIEVLKKTGMSSDNVWRTYYLLDEVGGISIIAAAIYSIYSVITYLT